jgi:hypothetical protein
MQFPVALLAVVVAVALAAAGCDSGSGDDGADRGDPPSFEALLSSRIPAMCEHEPTRLVDGEDVEVDSLHGLFELQRKLRDGGRSWVQLPQTPEGPLTAVVATCNAGGVGWQNPILFFGPGGHYKFHTFMYDYDYASLGLDAPMRDGVRAISADGSRLIVDLNMYKLGEGGCCFTGYAIVALEPRDGEVRVVDVLEHGTRLDGVDTPANA